ncbi:MAG: hypothetical protein QG553_376 [Patescibacteria group bacterium]|nr:hypothetical protein [Patescibacteria group bacterium]
MAKTAKRSTKKAAPSAKVANLKKQQSLAIKIIAVLLAVFALTALGTLVYTKYTERDAKAKAAAFTLRPQDYEAKQLPGNGVRMAVCKKAESSSRSTIVAIVSRPVLLYFWNSQAQIVQIAAENAVPTDPNKAILVTSSKDWFNSGKDAINFTTRSGVPNTQWIRLTYVATASNNTVSVSRINSGWINALYIPNC